MDQPAPAAPELDDAMLADLCDLFPDIDHELVAYALSLNEGEGLVGGRRSCMCGAVCVSSM